MKKKYFTPSNITTWVLVAFIAAMLIFPGVKATMIRGLMTVGLFQPKVPPVEETIKLNTSSLPQLHLSDTKGQVINTADQNGKVIFINFWATWCPPCIAEMPSIQSLYDHFKDNPEVSFLLIDVDNDPQKSVEFMNKRGWTLPVYFPAGNIPSSYFTGTLPTTVILDKAGNIAFKHSGTADYSSKKFLKFMENLSSQKYSDL